MEEAAMPKTRRSGVKEMVARAAADPEFAGALLQDPEQYRAAYGLSDAQVEMIKGMAGAMLGPSEVPSQEGDRHRPRYCHPRF
jgi:hypothetical protein